MIDTIVTKRDEWQHNLEHLQQRRAAVQAELSDIDANIMRHQGAILACNELLKTAGDDDENAAGVQVA